MSLNLFFDFNISNLLMHPHANYPTELNKVKTSVVEIFIDDDDTLYIKILLNALLTIEAVKEYFSVTLELLSGKKVLILFDGTEKYQLTGEAKAFRASKDVTETRIAIAFVTNSISNKVKCNLYLNSL